MTLSPSQVKTARELLGWSRTDLAKRVHLRTGAIAQFESGERRLPFFDLDLIKGILEAAGVEFIADTFGAPSVRLSASDEAAIPPIPPDGSAGSPI